MTTHKLVVMTNAVDGQDDTFNNWYDNVHLRDVVAIPGVVGAQRFRFADNGKWRYLALYDVEGDVAPVLAELESRVGTDAMVMTDAMNMTDFFMSVATPSGPYVK